MKEEIYSVEQVADLLDLHVRTVRGYIRSGRLRATRIGKQYRITRSDLDALTGQRRLPDRASGIGTVEVSSIVQIDGIDRGAADRLGTLLLAGAQTSHQPTDSLRIQTIHDEERRRMKIVVLGGPAATADLLRLIEAVLDGDNNGLFTPEADGA